MLAFLALLGAPYIYDISSLRVKRTHDWLDLCVSIAFYVIGIAHAECCFGVNWCVRFEAEM